MGKDQALAERAKNKVGIAGFNSAWSCAGLEDDRTLWLAAEWQFNSIKDDFTTSIRASVLRKLQAG